MGAEEDSVAPIKPQTRGMARRQAMLDAATDLFLEKGFEGTSLSDIVSRSRGSRSTLYEQFGNKEGLLRSIVEQLTEQVWPLIGPEDDAGPLTEEGLVDLGMRFVRAALAPKAIAVFRILVADGHRVPEIIEFFFDSGPRTVERLLARRFRERLRPRDGVGTPEEMGQVFLGAVLGVLHTHKVLGLPCRYDDDDGIEAHVRVAVRIFLDGIGHHRTP